MYYYDGSGDNIKQVQSLSKGRNHEKTMYDFAFGSDFMLHGRLPGQGSDGRAFIIRGGVCIRSMLMRTLHILV